MSQKGEDMPLEEDAVALAANLGEHRLRGMRLVRVEREPLLACGPLDLGPVFDEVRPEAVGAVGGMEAFLDAAPPDRERDGSLDRWAIRQGIGKRLVVFDVAVAHLQ